MIKERSSALNVPRSALVRKKLGYVRENLQTPYKVIGTKANMATSIISQFVHNKRDLNDKSLDRLEPVVDAYLKVLEYQDKVMKG